MKFGRQKQNEVAVSHLRDVWRQAVEEGTSQLSGKDAQVAAKAAEDTWNALQENLSTKMVELRKGADADDGKQVEARKIAVAKEEVQKALDKYLLVTEQMVRLQGEEMIEEVLKASEVDLEEEPAPKSATKKRPRKEVEDRTRPLVEAGPAGLTEAIAKQRGWLDGPESHAIQQEKLKHFLDMYKSQ